MNLSKLMFLINSYRNLKTVGLLFLFCFSISCVTQRKVEYFQNKNISSIKEAELPDYRLKPNDELFIQINSLDEEAANVFSRAGSQTSGGAGGIQPYGASLMSYTIDKGGFLLLPVIGNVYAKDKTLSEVSLILRDSLMHVLNQPVVTLKLVNRYVSVLGEVRNPGHFSYAQEKLSIYDAIGLAGDITEYGNRGNIVLIRNEDGENTRTSLNLTSTDILGSTYYYIRPNDIIYIKPLRRKAWGMREFPFNLLFNTITTGLLIYNIIKQ
jgi:polysaccharide biosynthesis/export protein